MEEKLKTAISLAMGLDDVSEEVLKDHEIVMDSNASESSLSIGGNLLIVTPLFVEAHNMAQLVGKIMHESRHVKAGHGAMWRDVRAQVETHVIQVDDCLKGPCNHIRFHAVRFIWNLVCDAVINADLKHVPVIRDSDGIQFGKYPLQSCSTPLCRWGWAQGKKVMDDPVLVFGKVMESTEAVQECIQYLKEHGYWGTDA
jgi:hypothetical protein